MGKITFPFSERGAARKGPRAQQPGNYIILSASVEVDRYTLAARIPRRIITDSLRFCLSDDFDLAESVSQSVGQVRETLLSLRGRRQSVDYPTRNGMGFGARLTDIFHVFFFSSSSFFSHGRSRQDDGRAEEYSRQTDAAIPTGNKREKYPIRRALGLFILH